MPQRLNGIEWIGKAVPAGGRWHELCDTCGSFRADSLRIEATFLPDHAGKELDRKAVLCRRLLQRATNVIGGGRWAGASSLPFVDGVTFSLLSGRWCHACLCIGRRICESDRKAPIFGSSVFVGGSLHHK